MFHSWIIFKALLNVHLFILLAVCSLVCQMCLVKSLIMFFCGHSRVGVRQERNFGNVHYLRDLRRHALGAQMCQAVSSLISLNATRPAQPISLGALEPFHDMAIFGLSEVNKFKIPFTLVGGYSLLDGIMGKGWDVKPLCADVADCHFKFVTSLTVYLDRKHFTLKFSFSYSEAPFSLSPDYREK